MANPRRPLRLNIGFLINQPVGSSRDFNFDCPKMQLGEDLILAEFKGAARLSRTPQGLLLQADFEGQTSLDCVRCLGTFDQALVWTATELYAFDKRSVTDSGLILPEDGHIDLELLMREYALLEIPISPVCKPDCKGLCPLCGEDCNRVDCGHQATRPESPFAALKPLLEE
ncbi:MAG: hypothetical protein C0393_03475 [Anaerolinea sp.]|nr:hypothetical protein [Anaerolinea sp.]